MFKKLLQRMLHRTELNSNTIFGEFISSDRAITSAKVILVRYEDEACMKLESKMVLSESDEKKLDDCKKEVASTTSNTNGQYSFHRVKSGWYKLEFKWDLKKKPAINGPIDSQNGFLIAYFETKAIPKKYSAFAQGQIFFFSGKQDVVKNFEYVEPSSSGNPAISTITNTFSHVIVLGAGASKDAGYPVVPDLLSFQYIDNLFKDLADSGVYVDQNAHEIVTLECECLRLFGDDLEKIFMEFERTNDQEGIKRVLGYYKLHFAFARDRAESVGADKRARCDYLKYFLNVLEFRHDINAVLSFNHDCLIETMADVTGRGDLLAYCLPEELRFEVFPDNVINMAGPTSNAGSKEVDFLKLHGSMNWVRCTACHGIGVRSEGLPISESEVSCGRCGAKYSLDPFIVPPNRKKDLSELTYLWRKAYEHLREATTVSFIGYSIPEYDLEAQQLFRSAFGESRNLRAIRVINKRLDDKLKQRYLDLGRSEIVDFVENGFKETFDHSYW